MGKTKISSKSTNSRHMSQLHIGGGGILGLAIAIETDKLAQKLGINVAIKVYERHRYGGGADDRSAGPRSHAMDHAQGHYYAPSQPWVSLALQRSTALLHTLAPEAFVPSLALTIQPPGNEVPLEAFFRPLNIWHERVTEEGAQQWFSSMGLHLPPKCRTYRVEAAAIDLSLLADALLLDAERRGIELIRQGVAAIRTRGETITALHLTGGETVAVTPQDEVVFACGAQIRPLLATADITVPGLRLFQSNLVAYPLLFPAILTIIGGPFIVPHDDGWRSVTVIGNTHRTELPPEMDGQLLQTDTEAIEQVCQETEEFLGVKLLRSAQLLAWPGVKTEIIGEGSRSQAHHACRVRDLANAWIAIPGKLSQAAACAQDLARKLLRQWIGMAVARSIWERSNGSVDNQAVMV